MMIPNLGRLSIGGPTVPPNSEDASSLPPAGLDILDKPGMVEFTVENPGVDQRAKSMWSQPYMLQWLARWEGLVRVLPTSYCQYATNKQQPNKPTSIMTTLAGLQLERPCGLRHPCPEMRNPQSHGRHAVQVRQCEGGTPLSQCDKNAIPECLIHRVLATWIGSKWKEGYRHFLLVDAFAGWGSVKNAVTTFPTSAEANLLFQAMEHDSQHESGEVALRRILARANPQSLISYTGFDAIDQRLGYRDLTLTEKRHDALRQRKRARVSVHTDTKYIGDYLETPNILLNIIGAELASMERDRVAVLVHASPPCTTFSATAIAKHRPSNGSLSDVAIEHDRLVQKLLMELEHIAQLSKRAM